MPAFAVVLEVTLPSPEPIQNFLAQLLQEEMYSLSWRKLTNKHFNENMLS